MSTSRRAVTSCGWEVKVPLFGSCVGCRQNCVIPLLHNRAISERFRDRHYKALYKFTFFTLSLLYTFTTITTTRRRNDNNISNESIQRAPTPAKANPVWIRSPDFRIWTPNPDVFQNLAGTSLLYLAMLKNPSKFINLGPDAEDSQNLISSSWSTDTSVVNFLRRSDL